MIGLKLRELRAENGMSLRELATQSGLSPALLSQVERGVSEPSLKTLRALASVFGESVAVLFDEPISLLPHLSRPGERSRLSSPKGLVQYERLTPSNGQLEVLRGTLGPHGASSEELWAHSAVECAYVLRGQLRVEVGESRWLVEAGEALTIDSNRPHRYVNETDEEVVYLVSVTPPTP